MTNSPDHLEQRMHAVDRYVQGEMSPVEIRGFESLMAADPSLAAEVASQQSLTSTLQQAFAPSPPPVLPPIPRGTPGGGWRVAPPMLWGAGAAVVAAAAALWVGVSSLSGPSGVPRDPVASYHQAFDGHEQFTPHTVDDLEVAISTKIGRNVLFDDPQDVVFGGITGAAGSPLALGVYAHAGSDNIMLVIDLAPVAAADTVGVSTTTVGDGLYRHSVVRGGLSFVEISPRGTPAVLDHIRVRP